MGSVLYTKAVTQEMITMTYQSSSQIEEMEDWLNDNGITFTRRSSGGAIVDAQTFESVIIPEWSIRNEKDKTAFLLKYGEKVI